MTIAGQILVVTKSPGWYGRCVQFFTGSKAYHTAPIIPEATVKAHHLQVTSPADDGWYCVSAEVPLVVVRPLSDFPDSQVTDVPMTAGEVHDAVNFAADQVGKPYAYVDIFFLLIAAVTKRRTPAWIVDRLISIRQWFCSELSDATMLAAGINLFPGRPACAVIPKDFLTIVQSENAKRSTPAPDHGGSAQDGDGSVSEKAA